MISLSSISDLSGPSAMLVASGLSDVPGAFILSFLGCVGFGLWIFNEGRKAFGKGRESIPQPLQAELQRELISREESDERIKELWDQLGKERKVHRDANANIHNRINTVAQKCDRMDGKLDGLKDQVGLLLDRALHE